MAEQQALTRFANNAIHQNVAERSTHLSVRAAIDGRTARATTNRLDPDSIRAVVEQAVAITRLTEPDPDLPPLAGPEAAAGPAIQRYFEATAHATPEERALAVAEAIGAVEDAWPDGGGDLLHRRVVAAMLQLPGYPPGTPRDHGAVFHHRHGG